MVETPFRPVMCTSVLRDFAEENLRLWKECCVEDKSVLAEPVEMREGKIPVYEGATLDYRTVFEKHLLTNTPCLIRNARKGIADGQCFPFSEDECESAEQLKKALLDKFSESRVCVAKCESREFTDQRREETTLGEWITKLFDTSVTLDESLLTRFSSESLRETLEFDPKWTAGIEYLKDWHIYSDSDNAAAAIPKWFKDDWIALYQKTKRDMKEDYFFCYAGPFGSFTPMHRDVFGSYSFSVNLFGTKSWVLVPMTRLLTLNEHAHCMDDESLLIPPHSHQTSALFDLSQGQCPYNALSLECRNQLFDDREDSAVLITQNTGEVLFVPSLIFHQTHNTYDPMTLSVNCNWMNACCLPSVTFVLLTDFIRVKDSIQDLKSDGIIDSEQSFYEECQNLMTHFSAFNFAMFLDICDSYVINLSDMTVMDCYQLFSLKNLQRCLDHCLTSELFEFADLEKLKQLRKSVKKTIIKE